MTVRTSDPKSPERAAFEHYLRSGEVLTPDEWVLRFERKFNPNHDERGRFTFAIGAVGLGQGSAGNRRAPSLRPSAGRNTAPSAPAHRRAAPEIPGYPEAGRTAWRSSNDAAFAAAADFYNKKYGLRPGDAGYRTPEFLKAWAMRETGGEGDERHFRTDPFQVNNPGDWAPEKQRLLGIRQGQQMTPAISAYAALEWLRRKSKVHDTQGRVVRVLDDFGALAAYNGKSNRTRQSGVLAHRVWYAKTILHMARQAKDMAK